MKIFLLTLMVLLGITGICGETYASEAQTVLNNATINGQFMQKTGFNALEFNGSGAGGEVITVANSSANKIYQKTKFSAEAWIYVRSSGGGTSGRVIDKTNGTSPTNGYSFKLSSTLKMTCTINANVVTSTASVAINTWTHVVFTWTSGSAAKIYINGVEGSSGTATTTPSDDSGNTLKIGNLTARTLDGFISRVRIWAGKELSTDEVLTLYNSGIQVFDEASPVSGITAEYNFIDGSGATVTDTYGNNGTVTGGSGAVWHSFSY